MTKFSKIITTSIAAMALAATIAATPASAQSYYSYRRSGPDAGAVAGMAIAGMAVGAMVAASQPHYGYYGRPYGYGYGYAPRHYGYYGYGY